MTKILWLFFTAIFSGFSFYHFLRARKSIPRFQNAAKVKNISGLNLGIHEFIESFNRYIEDLNRDNRALNLITGSAYLAAAATALLSFFLTQAPNKAPEPTPGSVTSRAIEGTSK